MKFLKIIFMTLLLCGVFSSVALAGDFDWAWDFNIYARSNFSDFKARLASRFNIGEAEVWMVLSNVERPSDAYILLRMGEMAHCNLPEVLETYKANRGKGWGVIAKRLGIKPGSRQFHQLKKSQDLFNLNNYHHGKGKGKGKSKHKPKKK